MIRGRDSREPGARPRRGPLAGGRSAPGLSSHSVTSSPDEGSRYLYSDHGGSRQVTGKSHPLDPREDRLPRLNAPVLRAKRRSPGSQTPRALRGLSRAGTKANATTVRSRPAPRSAGRRPRRQAREASWRRRVVPTGCRRISHRWRPGGSHLGSWAWQRNCFPRGTFRLRSPAVGELVQATVDQRGAATDPDGGVGLNAEAFGDGSGAGTSASSRMSCSAVRHHHRTVITTASAGR
jgi:hypothetical protein